MVYECDKCGKPLPPGVTACPACGERFDDAVPADASIPGPGFQQTPIRPDAQTVPTNGGQPAPTPPGSVRPVKAPVRPPGWNSSIPAPALWLLGSGFLVFILILCARPGGHAAPPGSPADAVRPPAAESAPAPKAAPLRPLTRKFAEVPGRRPAQGAATLSQGQLNSGFHDFAYARAYDDFGREIMRRDRDVKEVAESDRDSASGFYVIVRRSRLPASRAASRAGRYLAEFVTMRRRFFGPDEARKADMDLKSSDETTMATANQDGAKPDCIFYGTCGQQDAAEAAAPPTLDAAIARLQDKCGPDVTRDDLLRIADKAHDLMLERGVNEDPASIASHVADSIPAGYQPGKGVTDLFAAYISLRVNGGA